MFRRDGANADFHNFTIMNGTLDLNQDNNHAGNESGGGILDDGWQDPSLSYRATQTTVNGSPIVGFRITLSVADNPSTAITTAPYKVTLYKAGE